MILGRGSGVSATSTHTKSSNSLPLPLEHRTASALAAFVFAASAFAASAVASDAHRMTALGPESDIEKMNNGNFTQLEEWHRLLIHVQEDGEHEARKVRIAWSRMPNNGHPLAQHARRELEHLPSEK